MLYITKIKMEMILIFTLDKLKMNLLKDMDNI